MGTVLIDTLLNDCVKRRANELRLEVDQRPMARVDGQTQNLPWSLLGSAALASIVDTITPQLRKRELQETGETSFDFGFGDSAKVRTLISRRDGAPVIELQLS